MAREDLWLITSQLQVSGNTSAGHSQANGYATVGMSMPPGLLAGKYVCVRDLWAGSAPRLAYRGSEESPLNLHC
jgi:hypothetical protein